MEWLATLAGTLWGVGILMWIGIGSDPAIGPGNEADDCEAGEESMDSSPPFRFPRIPPGAL